MKAHINDTEITFTEGQTILDAARDHGHFIPTLCEMKGLDHAPGTCRVCLVEVLRPGAAEPIIVTSCNTPMEEGMRVRTRTKQVRNLQRSQVELILADHNQECASCIRNGDCELQDVAQFVGLRQTTLPSHPEYYNHRTKDESSLSIIRDMTKCIRCYRCVRVCRAVQGTDVLIIDEKGLHNEIALRNAQDMMESDCISCGQCTLVCPVAALTARDDTEKVIDYLYDPEITTVFQFAPAVRIALGEEFNMPIGTNVEGKLITALREIGADQVLDTNFTADLVIMEEGTELLGRIKGGETLPLMTSCSPGWINYVEKFHPEMIPNISTTKSPQQAFGAIAKTYLAEKLGKDPQKIRVVSLMPCTAKKGEAARPEMGREGYRDVDVVLTTRELARLLKSEGLWLPDLEDGKFENDWMGLYSGAAEIFGTTGGVMEAALRTVYAVTQGKELPGIEMKAVRGLENLREAEVDLGPDLGVLNVAVAHGTKAAYEIIRRIQAGEKEYHFVEVMGCPGGCMSGGGQPRNKKQYQENWGARQKAIYAVDSGMKIRQSHNNPLIKKLYTDFLGEPNGHKSHELLHTSYKDRKRTIIHTAQEIWDDLQRDTTQQIEITSDSCCSPE